ncbi:superoxide dismutase family protein, partial [Cribrihabitans sp. XS_ASV171]
VRMDDVSGRAFIIHGGSDDYESQPSGDAGERIACAMID